MPGLLRRYANPSPEWSDKVVVWSQTQVNVLLRSRMLKEDAPATRVPIEEAVIWFSDYTPEGQEFVMSKRLQQMARRVRQKAFR